MKKRKIYLDYAATTPVDPRVKKAMEPFFSEKFGNTMSLHSFGQEAKMALEESRGIVADLMGAEPNEIIFTGSATESNNLALKGIAFANRGPAYASSFAKATADKKASAGKHIIISQIEHPCIMEAANWLEKQGFKITRLSVDKYGLVNPTDVKKAIRKDTILVSIIHASNEIGTIQPIEKIGKICHEKKVYFHTDAVQSFGKIPIDVNKMNIDLLTASSHKMYGPKGAACLFIREARLDSARQARLDSARQARLDSARQARLDSARQGIKIEPLLHGGGQEMGLRSSTVNLPAIVGFAKACEICKKEMRKESQRLTKLRDKLIKSVLKIEKAYLNGPPCSEAGHPQKRLPNNTNFWFSFIEGESLVIRLDLLGIAASTGSACSSAKLEPSHILLATGLRPEEAHGSLRITLGRWTTEKEIDYLIKVLPKIVEQLRKISPYAP